MSAPTLYESRIIEAKKQKEGLILNASGHYVPWFDYVHRREWQTEDGKILTDQELKAVNWKWTGHYNTYIGKPKSIRVKPEKPKEKPRQIDLEFCPF